jgi:two-component system chemotaxis response regulator CheY
LSVYKNLRVLVVDDIDALVQKMSSILKGMGFGYIDTANSGNEAWISILNSVENQPYDLILSDINMKNGNGITLLKKAKESIDTCDVPFLIMSTMSEKDVVMKAIELGVDNFIVKPFDLSTVKEKIDSVLEIEPEKDVW